MSALLTNSSIFSIVNSIFTAWTLSCNGENMDNCEYRIQPTIVRVPILQWIWNINSIRYARCAVIFSRQIRSYVSHFWRRGPAHRTSRTRRILQ